MKKIIKNEDLENVNGGNVLPEGHIRCPECLSTHFDLISTEGSGCDKTYRRKCRDCGIEWTERC